MAGSIKVDKAAVLHMAQGCSTAEGSVASVKFKAQDLGFALPTWQGAAQAAFATHLEDIKGSVDDAKARLEGQEGLLITTNESFTDVDEACAAAIDPEGN